MKLYVSFDRKAPLKGKYINVNGLNVFYVEKGEENSEKLLLVHGYNSSHYCFVNNIEELSKKYHVIIPDLPGFGFSDKPLSSFTYTFSNVGKVIYDFLIAKEIKEIVFVGNSMGGGLGLALAADYPKMIKKLILLAPANPYDPESVHFFEKIKNPFLFFLFLLFDNLFLGKRIYEKRIFDNRKVSLKEIRKLLAHKWTKNYQSSSRKAVLDGGLSEILALKERITSIICPVLLIYGENDRVLSPEKQKILAENLKDCKEKIYENCGHMPQYEYPDQFHKDLHNFLED